MFYFSKVGKTTAKAGKSFAGSIKSGLPGFLLFISVAILAIGCASTPRTITHEWPSAPPEPKLVLEPGDTVEVKFRFNPELNEVQTVRPDGKISLQLLDEVEAAGITPEELDQKLSKLYEADLVKPELTVFLRTSQKQRVFVGGEVKKPGAYPMPGRLTALQAVMEAGGFDNTSAKPTDVIVIRHTNGKRYARKIDLNEPLRSAEGDNFFLAANDIVYVPRTQIVKIDQFVDQYINEIIPDIVSDVLLFYALDDGGDDDNGD